ncbi:MAG: hypothetical protein ABSG53_00445 [Thermoguttaceae bacterium]|jgi:flagellar M-ring protein FliF
MDFLNKAFAQFGDLFRSMTPGGRITAGLLLVIAVVSVGYLFQSQVNGGDDYLFSGDSIPSATLQKMAVAFGKGNLNGFTIEGGRVKVPRAQRAAYLAALADAKALPPNFGDKLTAAADGNLLYTPRQREEQQNHAKEEELALVINCMKGIEQSSVFINKEPQTGGFGPALKTASVTAWGTDGALLDEDQVDKIRYCVAAANGMKPENVTITDGNGPSHPGSEADHGGSAGSPYAQAVRREEQALNAKIRSALSYIPNVTVTSTMTLDDKKGSRSVEKKIDPKPIPIRTSEDTRSSNRDTGSTGGAPGLAVQGGGANQPASLGANSGKGSNETTEESKNQTVSDVSQTTTEKESYGLIPKTAKASIGIPASYYEKVWKEQNPVKEGEEAKKPDQTAIDAISQKISQDVRTTAANLLPTAPDVKDPTSLVTVTTFQDIKVAEIKGPPVTQRTLTWLGQNWPMMAMVGLVLFSLGVLRSTLRSVPAPSAQSAPVAMRVTASESKSAEEEAVETNVARRLRRMSGTGPSLRDELSEMVKEDPDSAANVLRSWIGQVS